MLSVWSHDPPDRPQCSCIYTADLWLCRVRFSSADAITDHQSRAIDFILTEMKVIDSDALLDTEINAVMNISCSV